MKTIRRKTGIGWEALFLGFSKDPRRRKKNAAKPRQSLPRLRMN